MLANRIATFNARSRQLVTCQLRADVQVLMGEGSSIQMQPLSTIRPSFIVRLNRQDFAPISISHVWRDDVIQLNLLEL